MNLRKMKWAALLLALIMLLPAIPAFASEPVGTVTLSFVDEGVRVEEELEAGVDVPQALGTIVAPTRVEIYEGDTVASVTTRFLTSIGYQYTSTGTEQSNFYLAGISGFLINNVTSLSEFDAGANSGWMITQNDWFINQSASSFAVEDGDILEWQYTCQLGRDIGCDFNNQTAQINDLCVAGGTLNPTYSTEITEYEIVLDDGAESVALRAYPENKWCKTTYLVGDTEYKMLADIPVTDGTKIDVVCAFYAQYTDTVPLISKTLHLTVRQKSNVLYGDVNGDGTVNVIDAMLTARGAAKKITLDTDQLAAADVNGDGAVNVIDAMLIARYAAKKISVFPVQTSV